MHGQNHIKITYFFVDANQVNRFSCNLDSKFNDSFDVFGGVQLRILFWASYPRSAECSSEISLYGL
jgi:hypothetical protein